MRQLVTKIFVGAAVMLTAASAQAALITVDFDSLAAGTVNPVFADFAFTNTFVVSTGFEASAPNSIVSASTGVAFDQANAVGVIFNGTASAASIVGLNVGFNGLRLDAFDAGNNLVAFATAVGLSVGGTLPPNPPGETFTLSVVAPNIKRLAIYQITQQFDDTIVLDNFSANVPVPEPATMALVGLGLAGVVARRRRRS